MCYNIKIYVTSILDLLFFGEYNICSNLTEGQKKLTP